MGERGGSEHPGRRRWRRQGSAAEATAAVKQGRGPSRASARLATRATRAHASASPAAAAAAGSAAPTAEAAKLEADGTSSRPLLRVLFVDHEACDVVHDFPLQN